MEAQVMKVIRGIEDTIVPTIIKHYFFFNKPITFSDITEYHYETFYTLLFNRCNSKSDLKDFLTWFRVDSGWMDKPELENAKFYEIFQEMKRGEYHKKAYYSLIIKLKVAYLSEKYLAEK